MNAALLETSKLRVECPVACSSMGSTAPSGRRIRRSAWGQWDRQIAAAAHRGSAAVGGCVRLQGMDIAMLPAARSP
jgi:hypothetical protein